MREKDKIKPNNISYTLYFQACIMLKSFAQGKAMHEELKQKSSTYMKNKVQLIFSSISNLFKYISRNYLIKFYQCILHVMIIQ